MPKCGQLDPQNAPLGLVPDAPFAIDLDAIVIWRLKRDDLTPEVDFLLRGSKHPADAIDICWFGRAQRTETAEAPVLQQESSGWGFGVANTIRAKPSWRIRTPQHLLERDCKGLLLQYFSITYSDEVFCTACVST